MIGDALRLLADETRLRVLHLLEREPLTVAELQQVLDKANKAVKQVADAEKPLPRCGL